METQNKDLPAAASTDKAPAQPAVTETPPAQPATETAQPAATPTPAATDTPPPEGMAAETPVAPQAPVRRLGVRPTPRVRKVELPKAAPPAPAPQPAAAPAQPAVDCSTPYYFEGQKKIFKPECL